jgi:hypothetical protein
MPVPHIACSRPGVVLVLVALMTGSSRSKLDPVAPLLFFLAIINC